MEHRAWQRQEAFGKGQSAGLEGLARVQLYEGMMESTQVAL